VAADTGRIAGPTEAQRRAWRAEIDRRATDDTDRAELLGMVLGEVA